MHHLSPQPQPTKYFMRSPECLNSVLSLLVHSKYQMSCPEKHESFRPKKSFTRNPSPQYIRSVGFSYMQDQHLSPSLDKQLLNYI